MIRSTIVLFCLSGLLIICPERQANAGNSVFVPVTEMLSLFVDVNKVNDPQQDGTEAHPFGTIQTAINHASHGTTIHVRPGTYYECLTVQAKSLVLQAQSDSLSMDEVVVDANWTGTVLTCGNLVDANCTVVGFVFTRGLSEMCSAVHCLDSQLILRNCLIIGNRSTDPTGSTILGVESQLKFQNCTIADNDNQETGVSIWLHDTGIEIVDSILWNNRPRELRSTGTSPMDIDYSNITTGDWQSEGEGNLAIDPLFARSGYWSEDGWVPGDYHLQSELGRWDPLQFHWVSDATTSLCIDAGRPFVAVGDEPSPNGRLLNLGGYGGTRWASKSEYSEPQEEPDLPAGAVYFRDTVLKQAVEDRLWVSDPTPDDMLNLTYLYSVETFANRREGISDLTGLEYATNLQDLHLRLNAIQDISPLSSLTNLVNIDLSQNFIQDLSPVSGLSNLRLLNLHGNHFSDISAISSLTQLERLNLRINQISDLSALSSLINLQQIDLYSNNISDLWPLSGLLLVDTLILKRNRIVDVTPLVGLPALSKLELDYNLIEDISALGSISGLSDLSLKNNEIRDISALTKLTNLRSLDLSDNPLNAEAYETHLDIIRANNPRLSLTYN